MISYSRIKTTLFLFLTPMTKADILLVISMITLGLLSFLGLNLLRQPGSVVQVLVHDHQYQQYPLQQEQRVLINSQQGSLEIQIANGKVWVFRSSCPTKTCMTMGKISRVGQVIVCIPNGILIRIAGKREESWINLITQ